MPQSVIVVDKKDNVATALRQLDPASSIPVEVEDHTIDVVLSQTIPLGHKFALKDVDVGEPIIKYGEVIGLATKRIMKGEHTHVHNVEGLRGRGDKQ
jgi:altronate dehydratase small subunit